jgi:hypothetical protein
MSTLKFYYKNVTAEVLGAEHGIAEEQFDRLAKKTEPLIKQLNADRKAGKPLTKTCLLTKKFLNELKEPVARHKV